MIRLLATRSHESAFKGLYRLGFASYIARVRALLGGAAARAAIITPFVDSDGVRFLRETWDARTNPDVQWHIYTREVEPQVMRMLLRRPWQLFQYSSGRTAGGFYGTHAKVTIVDDRVAIVGSMNLIRASMYSTLEVGIETQDPDTVRRLFKLEMMLRNASRRIPS